MAIKKILSGDGFGWVVVKFYGVILLSVLVLKAVCSQFLAELLSLLNHLLLIPFGITRKTFLSQSAKKVWLG